METIYILMAKCEGVRVGGLGRPHPYPKILTAIRDREEAMRLLSGLNSNPERLWNEGYLDSGVGYASLSLKVVPLL